MSILEDSGQGLQVDNFRYGLLMLIFLAVRSPKEIADEEVGEGEDRVDLSMELSGRWMGLFKIASSDNVAATIVGILHMVTGAVERRRDTEHTVAQTQYTAELERITG